MANLLDGAPDVMIEAAGACDRAVGEFLERVAAEEEDAEVRVSGERAPEPA